MNLVTAKSRLSDPVKRAQNWNRSKQRKSLGKAKLLKNTSFVSDITLVERFPRIDITLVELIASKVMPALPEDLLIY